MANINWQYIVDRTEQLRALFLKTHLDLRTKYPARQQTDERFVIFVKCLNVIRSVNLEAVLVRDHAQQKSWWSQFCDITKPDTIREIDERLDALNKIMRFSLMMFLPSMIESSFRTFVRKLDSNACNSGRSEFFNIYHWLLPRLTLSTNEYLSLLDILRILRNHPHTNAVFRPPNFRDLTINYKNKTYLFEDGKNIVYGTWNDYLDLVEDAHDMLYNIVESQEISSIPDIPSEG